MGLVKKQELELRDHLEGAEGAAALDGGYLYIYSGDELLHIASIPAPDILAERMSDSTIVNHDWFTDKTGNDFGVEIYSSLAGIHWQVTDYPEDIAQVLRLRFEVKLNDN
jgi:hypothetical protein